MRELPPPGTPCIVSEHSHGQRLDNYLLREWRGVPRPLIYRLIRNGNIRVNRKRAKPDQRLHAGDHLRLPNSVQTPAPGTLPPAAPLALPILYEDAHYMAVNKPAGLAVHGGSGIAHGVIERLRARHPPQPFLELAHRLDRDTSGILLLAKKRAALAAIQSQWRDHRVAKHYTALSFGDYHPTRHHRIDLPLQRLASPTGARHVIVSTAGKTAVTHTQKMQTLNGGSLLSATLHTGRTHQLRVHLAYADLPIVGDPKYGNFPANRAAAKAGHSRMHLHAHRLQFTHPDDGAAVTITAAPPPEFTAAAHWLHANAATLAPFLRDWRFPNRPLPPA